MSKYNTYAYRNKEINQLIYQVSGIEPVLKKGGYWSEPTVQWMLVLKDDQTYRDLLVEYCIPLIRGRSCPMNLPNDSIDDFNQSMILATLRAIDLYDSSKGTAWTYFNAFLIGSKRGILSKLYERSKEGDVLKYKLQLDEEKLDNWMSEHLS